jgi:hypothetical protein
MSIGKKSSGGGDKPLLKNKSKDPVYNKPEDTGEAKKLKPGQTINVEVDGICVRGMVYKITDGAKSITVEPNGSITIEFKNIGYKLYNSYNGDI